MSTSATYAVTLANASNGAVHGHKAGCADLARSKAYAMHRDEQFEIEVYTKREAWLDYNADFIAEGGEENAYPIEWFACAKHVPEGEVGEITATPATDPEKAADAVKEWRGNYNTVFAPAAEFWGSTTLRVLTVSVSTMLKESHIAGPGAREVLDGLAQVEEQSLAALRDWQKTQDRKEQSDMEKYNQNRSFLSGYLAAAAQQHTGAKKAPVIAFARDMEKALRPEARKAGAAARKAAQ